MKEEEAQKIAAETRKTYDRVAEEFSASRSKFWDELAFLVEYTKRGGDVLDIGCGNGRLFPLINERHAQYTGIDYSGGLIREAQRLHPLGKFVVGDATALPFPDDTFDVAYSFATVHHIPGNELRTKFFREAARVLRPGGIFVLTAWELWNLHHFGKLLVTALQSILGLTPLGARDLMLTFGKNKEPRYLHTFTERELFALLTQNGFAVTNISTIAHLPHREKGGRAGRSSEKNIVVVAKKNTNSPLPKPFELSFKWSGEPRKDGVLAIDPLKEIEVFSCLS
ncbi:MAG TPA: class I SAM-dependent methyltransferase [Candidatus Paceibacterota bacterium]